MAIGNKSVGSATTEIVAKDPARAMLVIANDSDEVMYLAAVESAVLNQGIRLIVNGEMVLKQGDPHLTSAWNGICTSGSKNATVFEG